MFTVIVEKSFHYKAKIKKMFVCRLRRLDNFTPDSIFFFAKAWDLFCLSIRIIIGRFSSIHFLYDWI